MRVSMWVLVQYAFNASRLILSSSKCNARSTLKPCNHKSLKHNNPDTVHLRLINLVVLVNATTQLRRPPVEQIKVQFSITGLEFLVLEEERVVEKCKGVEHVEIGLSGSAWNQYLR